MPGSIPAWGSPLGAGGGDLPASVPKRIWSNVRFRLGLWNASMTIGFTIVTVSPTASFACGMAAHWSPCGVISRTYV